MKRDLRAGVAISRRTMLGAVGAAVAGVPSFAAASQLATLRSQQKHIRGLGQSDLCSSAPALVWSDFDCGPITVLLKSTGRPVQLKARVPLVYGGPENTGVGISFAEDGVDLHHNSERGAAYAWIEKGTIVSALLEAVIVRQVPAGVHRWTLRVRHENPLDGPGAQRTYCCTRRMAPLELTAIEL